MSLSNNIQKSSSPAGMAPSITYRQVWDARFTRNPYISRNDQNARRLHPAVVRFAEFCGADFETAAATALGADFEQHLSRFLAAEFATYRKGGAALCGRREIEAGLRDCHRTYRALGPVDLAALPCAFGPRLDCLVKTRALSTNVLAKLVGCHGSLLSRWISGARQPDRTSIPIVEKLEQVLDVPAGTMTALHDLAYITLPGREAVYTNRRRKSRFGRYLTESKDRYAKTEIGRCLRPEQWVGQLADEWADLLRSSSWSQVTVYWYGYYAGCFFAYLVTIEGYALKHLSFALLVTPNLLHKYLDWDRETNEPNKIYNSRADHFINGLMRPLLNSCGGWLASRHELTSHSSFVGETPPHLVVRDFSGPPRATKTIHPADPLYPQYVWAMRCKAARDEVERLAADIKHHRDNSIKRLTWDRKENIQRILDLENPMSAVQQFFSGLNDCLAGARTKFAVESALRDIVIFELGVRLRLRASTIAKLKWESNIYFGAGNQLRLRLTRRELGHFGHGGEVRALDIELAQPGFASDDIEDAITKYLEVAHGSLARLQPGDPIIVSPRPDFRGPVTAQTLTQRATKITAQILWNVAPLGFSFYGFALIISECFSRANEDSVAANWLAPLAALKDGNATPERIQQKQARLFREIMGKIVPPDRRGNPEGLV